VLQYAVFVTYICELFCSSLSFWFAAGDEAFEAAYKFLKEYTFHFVVVAHKYRLQKQFGTANHLAPPLDIHLFKCKLICLCDLLEPLINSLTVKIFHHFLEITNLQLLASTGLFINLDFQQLQYIVHLLLNFLDIYSSVFLSHSAPPLFYSYSFLQVFEAIFINVFVSPNKKKLSFSKNFDAPFVLSISKFHNATSF